MAIFVLGAAAYAGSGAVAGELAETQARIGNVFGPAYAVTFGVALLAPGVASSATAGVAGQLVSDRYLAGRSVALLRRIVTVVPAIGVAPGPMGGQVRRAGAEIERLRPRAEPPRIDPPRWPERPDGNTGSFE